MPGAHVHLYCTYDHLVAEKSRPSAENKKQGKTLMEKRAIKQAKKAGKSKSTS